MKKVEAPNPYVSPPAARLEDMTQPMGPLEQGDQALVDAVQQVPEGQHEAKHDGGSVTWVGKSESLGQDIVTVNTADGKGAMEGVATLVSKIPAVANISADVHESPAGTRGGRETAHVSGNSVRKDGDGVLETTPDRAEAQATKLEVARRIDEARERLGEAAVEAADK